MSWEGLLGVVVGAALTQLKDLGLAKRKERSAREYLVARISVQLEQFANECAAVAEDFGQPDFDGSSQPEWTPQTTMPTLSFDGLSVDWTVIPHSTLYDVLRFPIRIDQAHAAVAIPEMYEDDPPYHSETFFVRTVRFGELGMEAQELARRLRALIHISTTSREENMAAARLRMALWFSRQKQNAKAQLEGRQVPYPDVTPPASTDS